jgi:uncharacterized protein (TIGR02145 family)
MRIFKRQRRMLALAAAMAVVAFLGLGCGGDGSQTPSGVTNSAGSLVYAGQTYRTVVINGKRWMAENLNYAPPDGGSWCYGGSNSNCSAYGRLYDWETAKKVCPAGWRLPSRKEWGDLAVFAGGSGEYGSGGAAGKKLKSKTTYIQDGNGTDSLEFSALAGGCRNSSDGSFFGVGYGGFWWTDTENDPDRAFYRKIYFDMDNIEELFGNKTSGFSVRCREDG